MKCATWFVAAATRPSQNVSCMTPIVIATAQKLLRFLPVFALRERAMSDLLYQLSSEHRALVWRMSNPTPQSIAAVKEQVAAYVKGESHD